MWGVKDEKIEARTLYQRTASFQVAEKAVRRFADDSDPLVLVVPIQGGEPLRQKVWLWAE